MHTFYVATAALQSGWSSFMVLHSYISQELEHFGLTIPTDLLTVS